MAFAATRMVAMAVGLAMLWASIAGIAETLQVARGQHLAAVLTATETTLAPDQAQRIEADIDIARMTAACGKPARDAVTLRLEILDAIAATADVAALDRRSEQAQTAIDAALRCSPTDGNLWLRLAMLEVSRHGPTDRLQRLLKMSYDLAPAEGWIMLARLPFHARLYAAGWRELEPLLARDMHAFATWASVGQVARSIEETASSARDLYLRQLEGLSLERRQRIARERQRIASAR